jgi:hypothetical protein
MGAGSTDRCRKDRSCHRHRHKLHPLRPTDSTTWWIATPPSARGIDSKDLTAKAM